VIKQTKYDAVSVHSTMTAPTLRPTDLLVYVLPGSSSSVVATSFGRSPGVGGTTAWSTAKGTGSEVYASSATPRTQWLGGWAAINDRLRGL